MNQSLLKKKDMFQSLETPILDDQELKLFSVSTLITNNN